MNTVATQTGQPLFSPTNQRHSRLYCNCSISRRLLPTVYRICSSSARKSFSGAIEGRPMLAYSSPNFADNPFSNSSVIRRIDRIRKWL